MDYTITTKESPAQPIAVIAALTTRENLIETIGELLDEVTRYLEEQQLTAAGPPLVRYLRFDDDGVELEAGYPVAGPIQENGRVVNRILPAGAAAVAWHIGAYDNLSHAYSAIDRWLRANNLKFRGTPYEIYWSGPESSPDPEDWRTEVYVPEI